jgi:ABC-type siderophore export system fused ATPase/permease subunit
MGWRIQEKRRNATSFAIFYDLVVFNSHVMCLGTVCSEFWMNIFLTHYNTNCCTCSLVPHLFYYLVTEMKNLMLYDCSNASVIFILIYSSSRCYSNQFRTSGDG